MSRYAYKPPTSTIFVLILAGLFTVGAGIWLFVSNYALGLKLSSFQLSASTSKVVWVFVALVGVAAIGMGIKYSKIGKREISIDPQSATLPASEWKPDMVTLHQGQIRSLKAGRAQQHFTLRIKYDKGSMMLKSAMFESVDDFRACATEIAAFAGLPLELPN